MKAAQEIYRILKPGGKLVIIDIDDGMFGAIYPDIMLLPSVLRKLADYQASKKEAIGIWKACLAF